MLINLCVNAHQSLTEPSGAVTIRVQSGGLDPATLSYVDPACIKTWEDDDGVAHAVFGNLKPASSYVTLSIQDTGAGMDSSLLAQVFTPFFTTKTRGQGSGLGLATVYSTILAHDGGFQVDSQLGAGTTFKIFLPMTADYIIQQTADQPPPARWQRATPFRVLLVDDDPDFITMMQVGLERHDLNVIPFRNPKAALKHFSENLDAFDAVISDVTMPEMLGTELVQAIKAIAPGIPCVLCTGYLEDGMKLSPIEIQGLDALLRKPISMSELLDVLSRVR